LVLSHLLYGGAQSGISQKMIQEISNKMSKNQQERKKKTDLFTGEIFPVVQPKVEYRLNSTRKLLENISRSLDVFVLADCEN
jgi:DNA-binding HxlR family transcriptional regulator